MTKAEREARKELRRVGRKRERIRSDSDELTDETRKALQKSQGLVPTKEAAELLKIDRSTAYEVYLREDESDVRRARAATNGAA